MAYSSLYVHMLWSTKNRAPQLTNTLKGPLCDYIGGIVRNLNGQAEIVNGVSDHIHLLARLPTTLSIAELARNVKGSSSHWANKEGEKRLQWQIKYGAFSVNPNEIETVRNYIAHQEEHHRELSFQEEFKNLLDSLGLSYDEKYLWE